MPLGSAKHGMTFGAGGAPGLPTFDLYAYGKNLYSECDPGTFTGDQLFSTFMVSDVVKVVSQYYKTIALTSTGDVYCAGRNHKGDCRGDGTTGNTTALNFQIIETGAKDIACGEYHTAILMENGDLKTFGAGTSGQLGNGSTSDDPTSTVRISGVKRVFAVKYATFAVLENGDGYYTGYDSYQYLTGGQTSQNAQVFTKSTNFDNCVKIGLGEDNNLTILNEAGELYGQGRNTYGETKGDGTTEYNGIGRFLIDTNVVKTGGGGYGTSWYIKENGDAYGFGHNGYSKARGDGVTTNPQATKAVRFTGIDAVECYDSHVNMIKNNEVWGHGLGSDGRLRGDGSQTSSYTSVKTHDNVGLLTFGPRAQASLIGKPT